MRKILLFASLVLSINSFGQIPTNGLVGYWPFNGNANDESGKGNNGIVSGATLTTDRFGNLNSAYSFDGSNDFIQVADNDILSLTFNTFCISFWININSFTKNMGILAKRTLGGVAASNWEYNMQIRSSNESYETYLWNSAGNCGVFSGPNAIVTKSKIWVNYILTSDGSNIKLYKDGILVDQGTKLTTCSFSNGTGPLTIGVGGGWNESVYFNGLIDDVRIYNRSLSDLEISSLSNEGICKTSITVTDTLIINANITGFNPVQYANTVKVYPNPTKDAITIDCGNNYSTLNGYTIKIANSLSQTVYTSKINQQSTSIKLNSWTGKGIYFVHIIDANSNTIDIKKIVLQ